MAEAFYLRVTLEPHRKHSGSTTGVTILFLAEVPMALAKHSSSNPDDEAALLREAERLAERLTPLAMTGHPRQEGEDVMRASFHAIPQPPEDILRTLGGRGERWRAGVVTGDECRIAVMTVPAYTIVNDVRSRAGKSLTLSSLPR